jgi:hypothetical protein
MISILQKLNGEASPFNLKWRALLGYNFQHIVTSFNTNKIYMRKYLACFFSIWQVVGGAADGGSPSGAGGSLRVRVWVSGLGFGVWGLGVFHGHRT